MRETALSDLDKLYLVMILKQKIKELERYGADSENARLAFSGDLARAKRILEKLEGEAK